MELYRIQSIKRESLWYSFDGEFKDRMKQITGKDIPMPFEEWRQEKGKLLSSCAQIEHLKDWFDNELLYKLFNSGYSLFKYEVDGYIVLPKNECVFDFEKTKNVVELDMNLIINA